jgi:hypothetical protein
MTRAALPIALVACLLSCPSARAQPAGEAEGPAFSLWSSQVYRTSEQASFSLTHRGLDHLDFRVYRVADPVAFFAGLKDPHALGSEKPVVAEEQSWIERIAAWKAARRGAIRTFLRRQVSAGYRQQRRAASDRLQVSRRQTLRYNSFAQVPLLNPDRLVASWREVLPRVREPESRRVPIETSAPGVYVVEAVSPPVRAYTIVVVTDIGIVSKTAPGQMLAFVADRTTGAPQPGCDVAASIDRRPLPAASTAPDGTVLITVDTEKPETVLSIVRCGSQVAVSDPGSWALQAPMRELVGYVFTDKPIYRPGHTVRVKGVLRWRTRGRLEAFDAREVEVSVADANDKVLARETRAIDAFGTIDTAFAVPASASLGSYVITIASGDQKASGTFEVQEYRKPEFEVMVTAPDRFSLQGQSVQATITARYHFGQPVAGGSIEYVVHKQPYYSPLRWTDEEPEGGGWWGGGQQALEATARLDDRGMATITLPLGVDEERRDYTARIEARVADASNREVSGSALVHATYGRFMVAANVDRYVQAPGATAQVSIRAVDYAGTPQAGAALVATLERLTYAEGRWSDPAVTTIASGQVVTDQDGRSTWSTALPAQPGSYRFRVTGTSEGREVEDSASVWVTGRASEYGAGDAYLELIADRPSYQPGDTARLVIRGAAVTSPVLVTKEGRQITYHRVAAADSGNGVDVPITADDIGDTYVNVVYLKDDRLYRAEKRVRVPAVSRQLHVAVEADRAVAKPAQPGVFTLTVTDAAGAPVEAQLSVGVVDEAVYGVKPESTADPLRFFHRLNFSTVSTDYSRDYAFVGYAGSQSLLLAQRRRPFTLADFKREGQARPQVRKDFPDAIFWAADVRTDARGRAVVQVPYPDALTTWRLTARAVTADTRVGVAVARTTTTKDLILRVVTPRFLTEGDTVELPVIVHNYLPEAQRVDVTGEVRGLEFGGGGASASVRAAPQSLTIPSGAVGTLTWTLKAPRIGPAVIAGAAIAAADSDAVELPLPVLPFGLRRESGKAGSFAAPGEQTAEIEIPTDANPLARTIRVQAAPSLAGPVLGALDYLTSYPYGCTEQTLSAFVPNLAARRTLNELGLPLTEGLKALDRQVTEGLARLYDYQHDDGGWGWWKTDENHPFMTAYAVFGLLEARDAGYRVDQWRLANGTRALRRLYRDYSAAVPELKAYEAWVLVRAEAAGISPGYEENGPAWARAASFDEMWAARTRMNPYGQSLLLLALDLAKDPRGAELARALEAGVTRKGDLAWWASGRDPLLFDAVDTSVEATAFAVKALAARDPTHALIEPAVRWLLLNRTFGVYWASTKQTAMVLTGLLDLMKARQETAAGSTLEVFVNGAVAGTHRFTAASMTAAEPVEFTVPAQAGVNRVRIVAAGGGHVYWAAQAVYYDSTAAPRRTGSRQLALQREYFALAPVTVRNRIAYRASAFSGTARPGDLLLVRLTAAGASDWRYLMIEDPIAAGTEPVQNDALYQLEERRRPWWGSRREFRDSRVVIFQERFDAGRYEFTYLLKVIAPGAFRASPARISAMYVPDGTASSAAASFSVTQAPAPDAAPAKGGRQ